MAGILSCGAYVPLRRLSTGAQSEKSVASRTIQLSRPGNIGGAIDLAFVAYNLIVTDVSVIEVTPEGLLLKETAPGWDAADIQAITGPKLIISHEVKQTEL